MALVGRGSQAGLRDDASVDPRRLTFSRDRCPVHIESLGRSFQRFSRRRHYSRQLETVEICGWFIEHDLALKRLSLALVWSRVATKDAPGVS